MNRRILVSVGTFFCFAYIAPSSVLAASISDVTISNNGQGATSNVNVQTNTGNNTICVNGKCTTTSGGDSKSTVCINGKCTTSNGNLDVQSDDGNSKVHISNNNGNSSVNVNQNSSGENKTEIHNNASNGGEISPTPSLAGSSLAKRVQKQNFDFMKFIQTELESFRKLLSFQFLFGNK